MASTVDAKRVKEKYDDDDTMNAKLDILHKMMKESSYTVFYTGAGVSTSAGIRDYRGPSGAWTEKRIKSLSLSTKKSDKEELKKLLEEREKEKKKSSKKVCSLDADPGPTHMAMVKMMEKKLAHYVITTNLDGLFRKAGLKSHIDHCLLHGDIYVERCTGCGTEYERNYHVRHAHRKVHDHSVFTCGSCGSKPPTTNPPKVGTESKNCGTKDTHINFGECLDDIDWNEADEHTSKADLCIVLGTSMSLRHITHFPFQAKKVCIINLQATPDDRKADLRIWGTCDSTMQGLLSRFNLIADAVPVWQPQDPLSRAELIKRGVAQKYIEAAERLAKKTTSRLNVS